MHMKSFFFLLSHLKHIVNLQKIFTDFWNYVLSDDHFWKINVLSLKLSKNDQIMYNYSQIYIFPYIFP